MTKRLQNLIDKYNSLRGEYWLAVLDDDPIKVEFLTYEIDRYQTLIAAQQARAILASEIKQLDKVIARGGL
jgi:hypothetical protein